MSETRTIEELITPALVVDLDIMEANQRTMMSFFRDKVCRLRPHFKNHKCVELAKQQVADGAIGMTTATLRETAALVEAGIPSILIANEVAGRSNLRYLLELAEQTEIILAVDNEKIVHELATCAKRKNHRLSLVVDIDLGMKRCGIGPGLSAVKLAKTILQKGFSFSGLMGYEGHLQRLVVSNDSLFLRKTALHLLMATRNMLEAGQIPVPIVSTAGTGTCFLAAETEGVTEVQAGNYLFMDTSYAPFAPAFQPSLSLMTTVISVTEGERFVINTGIKSISAERGMPTIKNRPGTRLSALHAEHGIVEFTGPAFPVHVGETVMLEVYYSDGTVNLHRNLYGVRKAVVEKVFQIGSSCD